MVSNGMMRPLLGFLFTCGVFAQGSKPDFERQVKPLLESRCGTCHGGDKRSGGLSLRDYASALEGGRSGALVVPGEPAESLLLRR